ncbi:MAG: ATP-binding cassette domain-containing protein [Solirubrobacteraceae bacterium]|nr:ATP-binding cassette domain-containing protein [Solirubrobacteraceae bacterium]
MSDLLPFIVAGLTVGAIYGLAAIGLVVTYKTSGVFNFAHGAIATVSAYAFYELHVLHGTSWPIAAAICVLVVGPVIGVLFEFLARAISGATLELRIAATIGVLVAIQAAVTLHYGQTEVREVPQFLPSGDFDLGGTIVQYSDLVTFLFAVAATIGLSIYLRRARTGLAMRAAVNDAPLLDLAGTSPVRTRRLAWMVGTSLAAASGVLFAPVLQLDPVLLTLLVVQAFGAAAIGRFTSLPWTFAGGLLIGVLASLCSKWFTDGLLAGLPSGLPFLVLFAVLLVYPRGWLATRAETIVRRRPEWVAPDAFQVALAVVVLVGLLLVPQFVGLRLTEWTVALATVIIFLSLGLLVRTSGQVSLGHVGFTAIGAAAFSQLAVDGGVPWLVALLLTGLVAVPIGALLAIPAIRLGGLYLALATFGFGVLLQYMLYTQDFMFDSTGSGLEQPRPGGFEGDEAYYYLVLGITVAACAFVVLLNRGRLGRLLRGMADSPRALATSGVSVDVTRVLVFCISAFLAAIGGALAAVAQSTASADAYPPLLSLTYVAIVVIAFGREPWYALMAAAALILVPAYLDGAEVASWQQLVFGVAAIAVAAGSRRLTTPAPIRAAIDATFGRIGRTRPVAAVDATTSDAAPAGASPADVSTSDVPPVDPAASATPTVDPSTPGAGLPGAAPERVDPGKLEVHGLAVRFGGLVAVEGFDLEASTGRITGLIGPNGAGKTTTFNACSGLVRPSDGRVLLDGRDVTRLGPAQRARLGLGRTFQQMELFESLTVRDNVAIGAEGTMAGANPIAHAVPRPGHGATVRDATDRAMALCDVATLADVRVGALPTGQRRLVELARCLAGPSRILLLDEPSSGLDHRETARFGEILARVVAERGVGILLVEHDMSLVLSACDEIFVLDFGRPIFRGTPDEVRRSPEVQAAYLGDPDVEDVAPPTEEVAG